MTASALSLDLHLACECTASVTLAETTALFAVLTMLPMGPTELTDQLLSWHVFLVIQTGHSLYINTVVLMLLSLEVQAYS